ncbi:MAG: AraC family transcriptional regulator [Cellvibrionaceae bacterium]|jgi:AraC family transcriptional regulator
MTINNKKIPGIILAESNSAVWDGLSSTLVDWQPVNREPFLVQKKTGLLLGYRFEGAIKSTYKLGDDKWRKQECLKDDFMIVRAHEITQWSWRHVSTEDASLLTMLLNVEQSLIDSIVSEAGINPRCVEFHHLANQRDPLISQIFKRLLAELKRDDPLSKFSIDILKQELIVHLLRKYTASSHKINNGIRSLTQEQLCLVNDYIESCYAKDITLKDLAKLVNLSEYHFSRLYKQAAKISPYQYILQCRLKRAQELLSSSCIAIQKIAFQIGYNDSSAFNKAFNKYVGITPSAYRKQSFR